MKIGAAQAVDDLQNAGIDALVGGSCEGDFRNHERFDANKLERQRMHRVALQVTRRGGAFRDPGRELFVDAGSAEGFAMLRITIFRDEFGSGRFLSRECA